ncbi:type II CAAX prenyl endopeptidase Rce1 family protein [Streptomyces sp. NPDC087894]|uniref:CPBP family glutamic-type intramembrane protease n=1 Tax=Streptomyces sp. NPDC087894 TaxID=3365816 RepID=UPI00381A9FA6
MGGPAAFLVRMTISGPLSDHLGWRGTAYPRMRATMGRFRIALVLGVIWAVWHMPLFLIDGTVQNDLGLATPGGVFRRRQHPHGQARHLRLRASGRPGLDRRALRRHHNDGPAGRTYPAAQAPIMGCRIILVALLLATGHRRTTAPTMDAPPAPRHHPRRTGHGPGLTARQLTPDQDAAPYAANSRTSPANRHSQRPNGQQVTGAVGRVEARSVDDAAARDRRKGSVTQTRGGVDRRRA